MLKKVKFYIVTFIFKTELMSDDVGRIQSENIYLVFKREE